MGKADYLVSRNISIELPLGEDWALDYISHGFEIFLKFPNFLRSQVLICSATHEVTQIFLFLLRIMNPHLISNKRKI